MDLERVNECWIVDSVKNDVEVLLEDALLLENVLNLEDVKTHVLAFIKHLLLETLSVLIKLLIWVYFASQRKLSLNLLSVILFSWLREDVPLLEVISELSRDFLKCLFRQFK